MKLTIEQALQQGVTAHKEGKLQEAERLYRSIIQSQPLHPDANHNLGILAVSVNKVDAALPLFKIALEANTKIEQFWLSYIDALIKGKQFDNAKQVLEQAKNQGVDSDRLNSFEEILMQLTKAIKSKLPEQKNSKKKVRKQNVKGIASPPKKLLNRLLGHYKNGRFGDAEKLALEITQNFPKHQSAWTVLGAVLRATGRKSEALDTNQTAVELFPQDATAQSNLGISFKELGRLEEAEASYRQAITLKPNLAGVHYNLGVTLQELGRLDEAEASVRQAIALKPDYAEAHGNLGITLQGLGRLDEAEASVRQAIALKPDYTEAYWNLHGIQKTIKSAEHWIDKCLETDENFIIARLMKAALRFYRGDKEDFNNLMQSESKQHPYMRSFAWVFSLPSLPELHFDKWYFFDSIIKQSITAKPFYEFGVWRASSFKYLNKIFKR